MKYGLKPLPKDERDFKFKSFCTGARAPRLHPKQFGHDHLVRRWGMFGNDRFGCCAWAGAAHETMVINAAAGRKVYFNEDAVLSDYAAGAGFNISRPETDQGTDMRSLMKYRRKRGIVDVAGVRHKIGAYLFIDDGDWDAVMEATYLGCVCALGLRMPDYAARQFERGLPWDVEPGGRMEGGHYVPMVGSGRVVTWGRIQKITQAFLERYCDAAIAIVTEELLRGGKTPEGLDLEKLRQHLEALPQ